MQIKNFDFSKLSTVIISLDGVLTDATQNTLNNWLNAGQDLHIPEWDIVWVFHKCHGAPLEHTNHILQKYNVNLQEFLSAVSKYSECEHIELNNHAIELLKALKKKSIQTIVTTSQRNAEELLKKLKITEYISSIIDINETTDVFNTGLNLQNTIIVDDAPCMIESALNSEALAVVAVESLQHHSSYAENQRVLTIKDLAEIIRLIGVEND